MIIDSITILHYFESLKRKRNIFYKIKLHVKVIDFEYKECGVLPLATKKI